MSKGSNRIKSHPVLGPLASSPSFEIFVDNQPVEAYEGDSVAAALLGAGQTVLRYTSSGKSPRGLFCGVGRCGDCLMQIDGLPARLACTTTVRAGQSIVVSAGLPSAPFPDPNVFNYSGPDRYKLPGQPDVMVVGAGFAGAGVALAIAHSGGRVYLVDEKAEPFFNRKADLGNLPAPPPQLAAAFPELNQPGLYPFQVAWLLQNRFTSSNGISLLNRTAATGLFCADGDNQLILTTEVFSQKVVSRRIVLATGSYSQPVAFPGWTLPGVLLEQAALDLLHRYRVKPKEPVLICGSGPSALKTARFMVLAGIETVGVVGLKSPTTPEPEERFEAKSALPFQYYENYFLGRAEGSQRVEQILLFPVDPTRDLIKLEVGTLVLTGKEAPLIELAAQAGARFAAKDGLGHSLISETNVTSLPGVYLAGKAAGIDNEPDGWQTLLDGWQLGCQLSVDLSANKTFL